MIKLKDLKRRRQQRLRYQLKKRACGRARLTVFRSGRHVYAQVIDDMKGVTLACASTVQSDVAKNIKKGSNIEAAGVVGTVIAERTKKVGVDAVVFDRGGYKYHGRIKALAEAARSGGLKF